MAELKSILSSRVSKWMGHTIATIFLPRSYSQAYILRVVFCLSTGRARNTIAFLERKVHDFIPPILWPSNSPDLNTFDYSNCSILQEKVLRSRIANVDELEQRLIDDWER